MTDEMWWEVDVRLSDPEEEAYGLMLLGAVGSEDRGNGLVRCYLYGNSAALEKFRAALAEHSYTILEDRPSPQRNWVIESREHWPPVRVGALTIEPCLTLETAPEVEPDSLGETVRLIPGTGFGTGDHPSTVLALEVLQEQLKERRPPVMLDFGTGSGILSLAAARLGCPRIVAVDHDYISLVNARDNIVINGLQQRVELVCGDWDTLDFSVELAVANLYAELLVAKAHHFARLIRPHGLLLTSGILQDRFDDVRACFSQGVWRTLRTFEKGEWRGMVCERGAD